MALLWRRLHFVKYVRFLDDIIFYFRNCSNLNSIEHYHHCSAPTRQGEAQAGAALTGGSQSLLGTSSGASTITKVTAYLAAAFIANSIFLAAITPQNSALDSVIIEQPADSNQTDEVDGIDIPNIPLPR